MPTAELTDMPEGVVTVTITPPGGPTETVRMDAAQVELFRRFLAALTAPVGPARVVPADRAARLAALAELSAHDQSLGLHQP